MSGLHEACKTGDVKQVRSLINLGADVEERDNYGKKPIHHASNYGHIDIVKLFIAFALIQVQI